MITLLFAFCQEKEMVFPPFGKKTPFAKGEDAHFGVSWMVEKKQANPQIPFFLSLPLIFLFLLNPSPTFHGCLPFP